MNRRELLKLIAAATGMAMIGGGRSSQLFGYGEVPVPGATNTFSRAEVAILDEIAEILLPRTDTPGAKDANCGLFMAQYVTDCYTPEEQAAFRAGLADINARTKGRFMRMTVAQRTELVTTLDAEAKAAAAEGGSPHYFTMFKQLAIFGFFTSEVGATKVLRYVAIPGRYDGDMPYEPGAPAWATS